ncbi:C39 family peptidase [Patescibacteria group bacterium]|nr:C39 family peptidase [Patescibacteria group bacterium]MCL5091301.1 C39 family peptidase [Patescibacteria group bacterium]
MNKIPKYFKQNNPYTCSLAVLRMVLAFYGIEASEAELINRVGKDYGMNFKNLWNPTMAKLARQYGINTTMCAAWPLFKKDIYPKALSEFKNNPETMNYKKYEHPKDKDESTEPLPLAYKEMSRALELGCKCIYGKLTTARTKSSMSKGRLVQTSIKLHKLYPGKKRAFHSILIYKVDDDMVFYHDPAHGRSLSCSMDALVKASNNVGAAMIYSGLV